MGQIRPVNNLIWIESFLKQNIYIEWVEQNWFCKLMDQVWINDDVIR